MDPKGPVPHALPMSNPQSVERLSSVSHRKTVRLTHHGRKTDQPYQVTIWFLVDGETVYFTTMDMGRQWTRNVQARPDVELQIGGERFHGRVESVVTDEAEMRHVVDLMRRKYPISRPYLWLKKRPDGAFRVKLEN
jgi:deazaflavin-dependent oxidoreductase (nitroreductase family)